MRVIGILIALLSALGCKSVEEKVLPPVVIDTPLSVDPTDTYELAEWWTNGTHLLQLQESFHYKLFEGMNRYHTPIERGRWSQQNYATLWLEPYKRRNPQRTRVSVTKRNETLSLELPDLKPLTPLNRPPMVLEDRIMGEWSGSAGTLRLMGGMRYSFAPSSNASTPPAKLARHVGKWSIAEHTLLLKPDTPGLDTVQIEIKRVDDKIILDSPDGQLTSAVALAPTAQ